MGRLVGRAEFYAEQTHVKLENSTERSVIPTVFLEAGEEEETQAELI